jgi:GntR family galactonate operon transcriptional repressor
LIDKRLYPALALHAQVAHEIGRQIVSGTIAEGESLPRESELAIRYGVSRQALREGLKVLAAKGLVVSRRRAGTRVASRQSWNLLDPDVLAWHPPEGIDPAFLSDLVELRRLIEPAAAAFAAERADPHKIGGVTAAVERMRAAVAAEDADAYRAADAEFHFAIFSASGNVLIERLSSILGPLYDASFRVQMEAGGTLPHAIAIHTAVYEAIVAGDGTGARRAMEQILSLASSEIAAATVRRSPQG